MNATKSTKIAVLLVNLGSPDEPTPRALRRYLAEFLSDTRVIDLPRWKWWPILHGIILRVRPRHSAKLYQKVWTSAGSPLVVTTQKQRDALAAQFCLQGASDVIVDYAMRYGKPSLREKIDALKSCGVTKILVVPMYPQYSDTTTASVFDGVAQAVSKSRFLPEIRFVHHWHDDARYIAALVRSFDDYLLAHGEPDELLLSFHGVPQRYFKEGDPYYLACQETAQLFREAAHFPSERIRLVFQSRFGREPWLQPYADKTLEKLPQEGVKKVAVMCPGFAADCLETLEEMALRNREVFMAHGGESYDYIPALNADAAHIDLLYQLSGEHMLDWQQTSATETDTAAQPLVHTEDA